MEKKSSTCITKELAKLYPKQTKTERMSVERNCILREVSFQHTNFLCDFRSLIPMVALMINYMSEHVITFPGQQDKCYQCGKIGHFAANYRGKPGEKPEDGNPVDDAPIHNKYQVRYC
ncbi:hypothetical protein V8G54_000324 [Vigna mungo]|uniref:CCHC-type domain-containing protein n=1 Tax=Vigna mungo TaxID=3915 RepID=A0AAQ3P534_VIGMU